MHHPVGQRVRSADPRLKILLALTAGVLTWSAAWPYLTLLSFGLGLLLFLLRTFHHGYASLWRAYLLFVVVWTAIKWVGDGLGPPTLLQAAPEAALFGWRLGLLLCLGLALALATPPRQMGSALAWALRPVMGDRAWRSALALTLMVHFLPQTWLALADIRRTMRLRGARLPWWRRGPLTARTLLRVMSQKTWTQTLALAARRLDDPAAWRPVFAPTPATWLTGVTLLVLLLALHRLSPGALP